MRRFWESGDIPADALEMLQGFIGAQQGRLEGGKYLDWLTMGSVSGLWEGMKSRTQAMLEDPGVYSIANWLTMGLLDLAEGALNPNKPLSLEHWLSSLGLASALFGMYEAVKQAIALRKDNTISSGRVDADRDDAPVVGESKKKFDNEIPRSDTEWNEYLKERYGAENVRWNFNSLEDIINNPTRLKGYTAYELETILGSEWTRGVYGSAAGGWKFFKGDMSIFYHPGGGRHGGSYYGISTAATGKLK